MIHMIWITIPFLLFRVVEVHRTCEATATPEATAEGRCLPERESFVFRPWYFLFSRNLPVNDDRTIRGCWFHPTCFIHVDFFYSFTTCLQHEGALRREGCIRGNAHFKVFCQWSLKPAIPPIHSAGAGALEQTTWVKCITSPAFRFLQYLLLNTTTNNYNVLKE